MAVLTVIGRGVRVRGRVTGDADLTIEGQVEGEVMVSGEVTIEANGLCGASVKARAVVVRGAVRGDLTGEEAVRLEEGARVVGDLHAPRIAIAKGALVRGLVQTGSAAAKAPSGKGHPAARPAPPPAAARRTPQAAPAAARPAPVPTPARSTPAVAPAAQHAGPKGPPPMIIPALKKGAKAALKKKAT